MDRYFSLNIFTRDTHKRVATVFDDTSSTFSISSPSPLPGQGKGSFLLGRKRLERVRFGRTNGVKGADGQDACLKI